jgi:hypothetical protein
MIGIHLMWMTRYYVILEDLSDGGMSKIPGEKGGKRSNT